MNIFKRKGLICFIAAIIITLSIPLTVLADGFTNCPNCGCESYEYWYNPEPTCINNGVIEYYCYLCFLSDMEAVSKLGHDPNIPKATCEQDKVCERCDEVLETQTGHDLEWNTYYQRWQCDNNGCSYYQYWI